MIQNPVNGNPVDLAAGPHPFQDLMGRHGALAAGHDTQHG
jgi:hypothetical protein